MSSTRPADSARSPNTLVILENTGREWWGGFALCALFFGFMWAYHDWWRGKTGKWMEWLGGKDPYPGPPGTLIGAGVVLLVLLLRGADWAARVKGEAGIKVS